VGLVVVSASGLAGAGEPVGGWLVYGSQARAVDEDGAPCLRRVGRIHQPVRSVLNGALTGSLRVHAEYAGREGPQIDGLSGAGLAPSRGGDGRLGLSSQFPGYLEISPVRRRRKTVALRIHRRSQTHRPGWAKRQAGRLRSEHTAGRNQKRTMLPERARSGGIAGRISSAAGADGRRQGRRQSAVSPIASIILANALNVGVSLGDPQLFWARRGDREQCPAEYRSPPRCHWYCSRRGASHPKWPASTPGISTKSRVPPTLRAGTQLAFSAHSFIGGPVSYRFTGFAGSPHPRLARSKA